MTWRRLHGCSQQQLTVVIPTGAPAGRAHVAMLSPRPSANSKYLSMALILASFKGQRQISVIVMPVLNSSSLPLSLSVQVLCLSKEGMVLNCYFGKKKQMPNAQWNTASFYFDGLRLFTFHTPHPRKALGSTYSPNPN